MPQYHVLVNPLPLLFKALLQGQNDRVFFRGHLNLRTTPETSLPSRKKKSQQLTKRDRMINLFSSYKFMHVITYSPNFSPPRFAARGIPKNTPHGTMEGQTAYICMLSVYPFRMELFSFSLEVKKT